MSCASFVGDQFRLFRTFAQAEGYGTSIAPENCDIYSTLSVVPSNAAFQNDPTSLEFYDSPSTSIFVQVQDPIIRRGSQVPTQNLIGIAGVSLEIAWPAAPAAATDLETVLQVMTEGVFELSIAGDRQYMARGGSIINQTASTPASTAALDGLGPVAPAVTTLLPSTKIVMPGSTIRALLRIDGSAAVWQAVAGTIKTTLHLYCFNARR